MQWIEVSVPTRSDEIDDVCAQLAELGAGGMVVEDEADFQQFLEHNHQYWDYVDDALEAQFRGVSRIKFYLSDDDDGRAQLEVIRAGIGRELTTATVRDSDWENNWRQYYQPIAVGEKLVVVPEWLDAPADGRIALRLDPGLIFGTGSPPTTRMCLAALEQYAGAGKTVLQHMEAKNADVDIVIVAACGERAGEVVEVLKEFPELTDPRTGRSLMERTIIICNTSSMPVAAREASVYTAVTMAEYYRQMGLNVLLLADSTSRWAQAMREMSGRLEEIPGEEAFPAYLESVIAAFYERAGKVRLRNGKIASVTIGGTVSPAGGNFEEPVTQATLKVVGAFHGLSRERSDARKYPSIHPIDSWSKYQGVVDMARVEEARGILRRSSEINQMMKVIGEEGTSAEDYILYQKGELLDAVYLQQNSFDPIDAACEPERQAHEFNVLYDVLTRDYALSDKKEIRAFFNQVRQEFLDWHGTVYGTPEFAAQETKLTDLYRSKVTG